MKNIIWVRRRRCVIACAIALARCDFVEILIKCLTLVSTFVASVGIIHSVWTNSTELWWYAATAAASLFIFTGVMYITNNRPHVLTAVEQIQHARERR